MADTFKPLFPITAEIPLDGEGWYEQGSKALVVVNFTEPLKRRLLTLNDKLIKRAADEPFAPVPVEDTHELHEIAAYVVRAFTINGQEFPIASVDDVRRIDEEVDGRLIDFVVWEAKARGESGVTGKRATFRADREAQLGKAKSGSQDAHPAGGAVADADKAD